MSATTPVTVDAPATSQPMTLPRTARVAVVRTRPERVLEDYARVMDLAGYRDTLSRDRDTLLKLNLSWTKYFPSCSSQPWQVDGVIGKMLADGFSRERLIPIRTRRSSPTRVKGAATTAGSRFWRGTG